MNMELFRNELKEIEKFINMKVADWEDFMETAAYPKTDDSFRENDGFVLDSLRLARESLDDAISCIRR